MEIKQNSENQNTNIPNEPDLDEVVNKLPEYDVSEQTNFELPQEQIKSNGYKTDSLLFHFLSVFGIVFLSVFFIFGVYLTPITVVGESMLPNINKKTTSATDKSHCDVVYYKKKDVYTYGDVIIISNETSQYINNSSLQEPVEFLIKRVIACPGDTITFYLSNQSSDNLYYYYDVIVKNHNGQQVELNEESHIKEQMIISSLSLEYDRYSGHMKHIAEAIIYGSGFYSIKISDNCYFAMGDNRNYSSDSRVFGEIHKEDICGNVRLQVEYGENIWIALFKKIKSYLSCTLIVLKENL